MNVVNVFLKKYPNWQHSVAAFLALLPLAYAEVPQFHAFVVDVLAAMPHLLKEGIFAAVAVVLFYRNMSGANSAAAEKPVEKQP